MILRALLTLAALVTRSVAQDSSAASTPPKTRTTAVATAPPLNGSANYPVLSVFAPIDVPQHLGGSIVTALPDRTILAIGCLPQEDCGIGEPYTVTNGESTFIATNTFQDVEGSSAPAPLTVTCNLDGGLPAIAATCTGETAISGLGNVASTYTLAETQISYAKVTVTGGADKLEIDNNEANGIRSGGGRTGNGVMPKVTPAPRWVAGGAAAGMALLGVV